MIIIDDDTPITMESLRKLAELRKAESLERRQAAFEAGVGECPDCFQIGAHARWCGQQQALCDHINETLIGADAAFFYYRCNDCELKTQEDR